MLIRHLKLLHITKSTMYVIPKEGRYFFQSSISFRLKALAYTDRHCASKNLLYTTGDPGEIKTMSLQWYLYYMLY